MDSGGKREERRSKRFRRRVLKGRGTDNDHRSWLKKAAEGDIEMAWAVVSSLADVLSDLSSSGSPNKKELQRGAEFFDGLFGIKNGCGSKTASKSDLASGLEILGILPRRGPKTKMDDARDSWAVIEALKGALEKTSHCPVLARHAAAFFGELLSIRAASATGQPSRVELGQTFARLNLLVPAHRPAMSDLEKIAYLAAEQIEREKHRSERNPADAAREAIETKHGKSAYTLRDRRTQRPDLVHTVSLLADGERETLASCLEDEEGKSLLR
ncbi:MAG: hypothetical protein R3F10_03450 [Lysobacteraceae bacterium]